MANAYKRGARPGPEKLMGIIRRGDRQIEPGEMREMLLPSNSFHFPAPDSGIGVGLAFSCGLLFLMWVQHRPLTSAMDLNRDPASAANFDLC